MFQLGRLRGAAWTLGAFALFGCDDSSGGNPIPPPPTMIVVDPEQFDTAVACVAAPGAMRLYVATLFDVTDDSDSVPQLASSPPTPCTIPVGFGYVEPGRKYRAEVDGYDVDNLEPLTAGNRLLQHEDTGELVAPRWRASCGNPLLDGQGTGDGGNLSFLQGPAEAFLNASVTVMGCTPFSDDGMTPLGTSIRVDLSQALGALSCGDAPGQVSSYQVSQRDSATAPISASCESTVSFDQLAANQTYFFDVLAFPGAASVDAAADNTQASDAQASDAQAGDAQASDAGLADAGASHASDATTADAASALAARWRTTCYQQALSGVQQTAICEPLAPIP